MRKWWKFGGFRFDGSLLFRGEQPVDLGSRSRDKVLLLLLENAGALVTREKLSAIWPAAESGIVDQAISQLRLALKDRQQGADRKYEYIRTKQGRGYVFVKPVRIEYEPRREVLSRYYEGLELWNRRTPDSIARAIQCFADARDRAWDFTPTHAALADCYAIQGAYSFRPPEKAADLATQAALDLLRFDNGFAPARTTLGFVNSLFRRRWSQAESEFLDIRNCAPDYATAHHWYALHLAARGRLGLALDAIREAHKLEPLSRTIHVHLATILYWDGEYAAALGELDEVDKTYQDAWYSAYTRGLVYERQGAFDRAIEMQLQAREWFGQPYAFLTAALARARALGGDRQEARRLLEEAHQLEASAGTVSFHIAAAHAALGDPDVAFEHLFDACDKQEVWISFALVDPRLDALRPDPRFAGLLANLGLKPADS